MTQEEIEEYKKNPYYCPECKCEDIIKIDNYWSDLKYNITFRCEECQFEWKEEYELVTIRPLDET